MRFRVRAGSAYSGALSSTERATKWCNFYRAQHHTHSERLSSVYHLKCARQWCLFYFRARHQTHKKVISNYSTVLFWGLENWYLPETRPLSFYLLLATIPELFIPLRNDLMIHFFYRALYHALQSSHRFCLFGSSFFSHRTCHQMMLFLFLELSIIHILREWALYHLSVSTNDVVFIIELDINTLKVIF